MYVVEINDMFVLSIGFLDGFFVGIDSICVEMWGLYCFGVVVFVCNSEKDIVSIEFYIVFG